MKKTNEEILKNFIKANKTRREQIAQREGFDTPDQYKEYIVALINGSIVSATASITEAEPTDVVVAFDTTGSMMSYLDSVKSHVKQVITDMFKNTPNLRMKIVAFGDYCDMTNSKTFGKAYQETSLTDNENELINFVQRAQSTSGGDSDEFYELVIRKITEETPWRDGKRSVLLIADYAPHPVGYSYKNIVSNSQIDWRVEAQKAANLGIQFDTLRIIPQMHWYAELSQITNGLCMDFKNSGKISEILEASTYVRSSKEMFKTKMDAAFASGDSELIGAYKTMSAKL